MMVSIITVCYNSENTIYDTLNCIKNQSFNNIEHIIIDGGSQDSTIKIIANFPHVSKIVCERDSGIYDAMNKGLKFSTGDIIGILNSDDLLIETTLIEEIVKIFENNEDIDIVYGNLLYIDSNNMNKIIRKWKSTNYFEKFFDFGNVPPHPTVYLRRSVYDKVGNFDINFKLASDYDLMLRIFKKEKFKSKFIDKYIVKMRIGGVTNKNWKNRIIQNIEIYNSWTKNKIKPPFYFFFYRFYNRISQYL